MEEEKNNYLFFKLLLFCFILFLILFISNRTGYAEYKVYSKTKLTEEAISRFETDISNGKDVSIEDYLVEDNIDYSNKISILGSKIGSSIETIMNKGLKKTLKILSDLFYE